MRPIYKFVSEDTGLITKTVNGFIPETVVIPLKKSSQDEPSQFADFWNSIEAELKESETFERVSKVDYSYTLGDYDDDVMYLMY